MNGARRESPRLLAGPGQGAAARGELPEEAWLVALAELPDMWPSRLAALLGLSRRPGGDPPAPARRPPAVWEALLSGAVDPSEPRLSQRCQPDPVAVAAAWRQAAATCSVARRWQAYRAASVRVHLLGDPDYPTVLASDVAAPYVLYSRGRLAALEGPRVAIVGTRRCTPTGREIAVQFGRELAEAGACVVSGLALGIDGAAHCGALAAGATAPAGVVAGGLDRPYPSRHRDLWRQVAAAGVLLSEATLGTANEAWRFPARNRVLAALADVVVVVESHASGGSIITAEEALKRGKRVLAVPGPIRSPASAGTNRLFRDGAGPACDPTDVLAALALERPGLVGAVPDRRPLPEATAARVLEAVDWAPTTTETVLDRTDLSPGDAVAALVALEMDGWVRASGGTWERRPAAAAERGEGR